MGQRYSQVEIAQRDISYSIEQKKYVVILNNGKVDIKNITTIA